MDLQSHEAVFHYITSRIRLIKPNWQQIVGGYSRKNSYSFTLPSKQNSQKEKILKAHRSKHVLPRIDI